MAAGNFDLALVVALNPESLARATLDSVPADGWTMVATGQVLAVGAAPGFPPADG